MRNLLLLPCLLVALIIVQPSQAYTLKVATLSPDGSHWMTTMREASKTIAKETDNRVRFRFYPGGVMGNDKAVLKKIRIGQLHGAAFSGGALSSLVPDTQIYNLPRLFDSYAEVDYVRKTLDKTLMQDFEKNGWVNFGLAEGGFAYMMSKNPINTLGELKEHKVWVPSDDPTAMVAAKTMQITPVPLSLGDVLASLQTELVDTVFASPIAAIALQWHTQIDYVTDMPLVYFYGLLAINDKAFNKISSNDQIIVRKVMSEAFKKIDQQNRRDNEAAFLALKKQGIKFITPPAKAVAEWNQKTALTNQELIKSGAISQSIYTQTNQLINEFRKNAHTEKTHQFLTFIEDGAIILLALLLLGISITQIILRNLDLSGILWAEPAMRVIVLWLAFLGAMRASRLQNHIAINLLQQFKNVKLLFISHKLSLCFSALVCSVAAYFSWRFLMIEYEDNQLAFLSLPAWLVESIIPLGLSLISIRFIYQLFLPIPHDTTLNP